MTNITTLSFKEYLNKFYTQIDDTYKSKYTKNIRDLYEIKVRYNWSNMITKEKNP